METVAFFMIGSNGKGKSREEGGARLKWVGDRRRLGGDGRVW